MFRGVLAVVAASVIWGLASATSGVAAPSCWQLLVHDWADGGIDGTYRVSCYRQALVRMPEDLQAYSSAPDDIEAALQRRVHQTGARSLAVSGRSQRSVSSAGWAAALPIVGFATGLGLALVAALALAVRRIRRT